MGHWVSRTLLFLPLALLAPVAAPIFSAHAGLLAIDPSSRPIEASDLQAPDGSLLDPDEVSGRWA